MENKTKKIAYFGMLIALAFIFSYIESLVPINVGIPGIKLGLANLVVIVGLYLMGAKEAFVLSIIRIVLVGFTFGNMASMMYSMAGGLLSYCVMTGAKKIKIFSTTGVSVLGGIFHNIGQILMAMFVLNTPNLIYYLPVLIISGLAAGIVIGIIGAMIIKRLEKALFITKQLNND